jgi:hypothetical protein
MAPRYRFDIRNEDVEKLLKEGVSVREICAKFDCAQILVRRVRAGTRPNGPPVGVAKRMAEVRHSRRKPCSVCGVRVIAKDLRFLCRACYHGEAFNHTGEDQYCLNLPR